jgi:hypothetical protein
MSENKKAQYLPFHAINEFMRDDFRITILQEVLNNFDKVEKEKSLRINRLIAKGVQIPGFRNSSLAPLGVKVRQSTTLFENSPEFAALIVDCWSQLHLPLKKSIWELLEEKNWKPLPQEIDRTTLPGFLTNWPKEDKFESLVQAIHEKLPDLNEGDDNISLMVVWIGNKLPVGLYDETSA